MDLVTNALGGIDAIRVTDDGTGIDILRADETFGSLGGSWKRTDGATTATRHRRLHGRHGRGRFKAFSLGSRVEWRTTVRVGGELLEAIVPASAAAGFVGESPTLHVSFDTPQLHLFDTERGERIPETTETEEA